jgi:3-deoxy-manno-octulosonate cytidylyltransferase (CMP-KDO synthetase)
MSRFNPAQGDTPDFLVVIPARYNASRLPGKPLLPLAGKPMIEHVYTQARKSAATRVLVATDDQRIAEVVEQFGGEVCLTRPDHLSGTDRLQEVASALGLTGDSILVNVQGDEPLIPPAVINQVARLLHQTPGAGAATLCHAIHSLDELFDPNAVKLVADQSGRALYFSRAPIPWGRDDFAPSGRPQLTSIAAEEALLARLGAKRHIGIYAYRAALLHQFVGWAEAPLERIEKLEQLRILFHGERIAVADAEVPVPGGVDTAADAERVKALMAVAS